MKSKNIFRVIAGAILSLLGFSGCDIIGSIINPVCEYGCPHADYKIIGEVKDQDGAPIKDLKVKYRHYLGTWSNEQGEEEENWYEQEFTTDANGKVNDSVADWDAFQEEKRFEVHLIDVDGEANGLYDTKVLAGDDLTVVYKDDKDGGWHVGDYTISFSATLTNKLAGE